MFATRLRSPLRLPAAQRVARLSSDEIPGLRRSAFRAHLKNVKRPEPTDAPLPVTGPLARSSTALVKPRSLEALQTEYSERIPSLYSTVDGFEGALLLLNRNTNQAKSISLWSSRAAFEVPPHSPSTSPTAEPTAQPIVPTPTGHGDNASLPRGDGSARRPLSFCARGRGVGACQLVLPTTREGGRQLATQTDKLWTHHRSADILFSSPACSVSRDSTLPSCCSPLPNALRSSSSWSFSSVGRCRVSSIACFPTMS